VGPQQGRKVFTLQTLPDCRPDNPFVDTVGKVAGFSLHAGVATKAHERDQLERLCRYIARPAVSTKRLALTRHSKVRYELKTPNNDGTTQVLFEPLDFISRLAALVPKPRVNLTRFHGVFAPNSKYRARVTLAKQEEAEGLLWVDCSYSLLSGLNFRFCPQSGYSTAGNFSVANSGLRPGAVIQVNSNLRQSMTILVFPD